MNSASQGMAKPFQSTRPVRGATYTMHMGKVRPKCFNPRAPCGARHAEFREIAALVEFQSTRPVRGATKCPWYTPTASQVSIHAPRAGRDNARSELSKPRAVSIHAPRAGRDTALPPANRIFRRFQSTRPVRGATWLSFSSCFGQSGFNPRAPCGARPFSIRLNSISALFQSTRPVRGATLSLGEQRADLLFQSTRPVRGATTADRGSHESREVSIHAPRAGRDSNSQIPPSAFQGFNPRAPCGARLDIKYPKGYEG